MAIYIFFDFHKTLTATSEFGTTIRWRCNWHAYNTDGYINFAEYSQQMAYQTKQAEQETYEQARRGNQAEAQRSNYKADALRGLTGETRRNDNFDDLYANYGRY